MAESAAPAIQKDMNVWTSIGGGNSGIVGNRLHTYGFHRGGFYVPSSDYSRRRDPRGANGYANGEWACAGDFGHNNNPALLNRLTSVLARLVRGDPSLWMVCEYIGRAYAGGPVMYWFRGDGLSRYSGEGHDTWSHVSVWRSAGNIQPHLFDSTPAPAQTTTPQEEDDDEMGANTTRIKIEPSGPTNIPTIVEAGAADPRPHWLRITNDTFGNDYAVRVWWGNGKGGFAPLPLGGGTKIGEGTYRVQNGVTLSGSVPKGCEVISISRAPINGSVFTGDLACMLERGAVIK